MVKSTHHYHSKKEQFYQTIYHPKGTKAHEKSFPSHSIPISPLQNSLSSPNPTQHPLPYPHLYLSQKIKSLARTVTSPSIKMSTFSKQPPFPPLSRHILQTLPDLPLPSPALLSRVVQIAESLEPGLGWLIYTFLADLGFVLPASADRSSSSSSSDGNCEEGQDDKEGVSGDGICRGKGKERENDATIMLRLVWWDGIEFERQVWRDERGEEGVGWCVVVGIGEGVGLEGCDADGEETEEEEWYYEEDDDEEEKEEETGHENGGSSRDQGGKRKRDGDGDEDERSGELKKKKKE
ncbi:hypothetical protein DE146DRAFT_475731 [Phaeosphaeria sp. MPI-PUGE-AT-0046c]|nr:hypothetical protein DE146DRAFT_475731 [Phaeosphaeria sp. MPI-PUGE-AT-0046c]